MSFFKHKLGRKTVTQNHKKDVNAILDFFETVVKGHWLACASDILGVESLNGNLKIPILKSKEEKKAFIESIAKEIVDRMTVVDSAFMDCGTENTNDPVYNYARVLCHFGSLSMLFQDSWREGDGDRVERCWKLFLPHYQSARRTKYSLEARRLQFQVKAVLSPNLSHQVKWHRFVNTRGGLGRNVPCDLHNEHMNKLIKDIIIHMGSNISEHEAALQRSVRSISTLDALCHKFDEESDVPHRTTAHSTRSDLTDVNKVIDILLKHKILEPICDRTHKSFPDIHFNPLHKWDSEATKKWIEEKKAQYLKQNNKYRGEDFDCFDEEVVEDEEVYYEEDEVDIPYL